MTSYRLSHRAVGLAITDEIASHSDWTMDEIQTREEQLIAWAAEYWSDVQP